MRRLVLPGEEAYTAGGKLLPPVSLMRSDAKLLARFWQKVEKPAGRGRERKAECWLWTAAFEEKGYGVFSLRHDGLSVSMAAHRLSYALSRGTWPTPSMMVCHECDNPRCVNPHHLHIGTAADNNEECRIKGRWRNGAGGKRIWIPPGVDNWTRGAESILRGGSSLTPHDVKRIRASVKEPGDALCLAFDYDCTEETINAIAKRERFAWVHGETT